MISIIIPVYKAEKTLKKCVSSLTCQSYKDIEIILVNDCSPDSSKRVCFKLMDSDRRIRYIETERNSGVEVARFKGFEISKGKYIMFIDCDDWIEGGDTLKTMYDKIEETDSDFVEIQSQRVIDRYGILRKSSKPQHTGLIEGPELMDKYYMSFFGVNILSVNIWAKLYRKSTIEKAGLRPHGLKMCDDLLFNMQIFPYLKRIYIIDKIGHNYRYGGLTTRYNPYFFPEHLYLYEIKKKAIEKYNYIIARKFILIELKNVLKSDIIQAIRFTKNKKNVMDLIKERLSLDVWHDIESLNEYGLVDDFSHAIASNDINSIYAQCKLIENNDRHKYLLKRFLSKLFSILQLF